jgi:hypothetical protein
MAVGCGADGRDSSGSLFGSGDGGSLTGDGASGGGRPDCSGQAADYVYVLSDANDLYSFKPDQKQFTKIGRLNCNTTMQPNSMAIDRNADAWVDYVAAGTVGASAGEIYKVSTRDASCSGPAVQLPPTWFRDGMGYSTDGTDPTDETLYVAGSPNLATMTSAPGLGKIDLGSGSLATIGAFTGARAGQSAELTGTGDGRLYGFFTTTPVQVAELTKATGAVKSSTPLAQVETPRFWAFSFWGGKFYLYTCPDTTLQPQRTSNVNVYDPMTGAVDPAYMTNVGFRIVGAGVSTCAPLMPPR